jgi:hypothetical protein
MINASKHADHMFDIDQFLIDSVARKPRTASRILGRPGWAVDKRRFAVLKAPIADQDRCGFTI